MSKFMTGLLLGVGIGLLLAPEKGEDTREAIADTAENWKNKWDKLIGKAATKLDDVKALLASEVAGLSDDVRNRILTILEEEGIAEPKSNGNYNYKDEFKPI